MNRIENFIIDEAMITIPDELRANDAKFVPQLLWHVEEGPHRKVTFDFSRCVKAFPNVMLPLISGISWLRRNDTQCKIVPPRDRKYFERTNYLHFLDPTSFGPSESASDRHLAIQRFSSPDQQTALVSRMINLVLSHGEVSKSAIDALNWCMNEITGNILDHAESEDGGLFQLEIFRDRFAFCVVDSGHGILKTLQPSYAMLRKDTEAIQHAVRRGVTRDPARNQGNGLTGSLNLAKEFQGQFAILSYGGLVRWSHGSPVVSTGLSEPFPGTMVDLQMRRGVEGDVVKAITGTSNTSYRPKDVMYEMAVSDEFGNMSVEVGKETFGFGNRVSGAQLRNKCENLLRNNPVGKLTIDWLGIPVIASSFADEFIGKLFVSLGPTQFMKRIRLQSMDPTVARIVDFAVQQRAAESWKRPNSGGRRRS